MCVFSFHADGRKVLSEVAASRSDQKHPKTTCVLAPESSPDFWYTNITCSSNHLQFRKHLTCGPQFCNFEPWPDYSVCPVSPSPKRNQHCMVQNRATAPRSGLPTFLAKITKARTRTVPNCWLKSHTGVAFHHSVQKF